MKAIVETNGIFIDISAKDLCQLITNFEYVADKEYINIFDATISGFSGWDVSLRQDLVIKLLKKHLKGEALKKVLIALDSADTSIWK